MKRQLPTIKYALTLTFLLGLIYFSQVNQPGEKRYYSTRIHSQTVAVDTNSKAYLKGFFEKEKPNPDYLNIKNSLPTPLLVDAGGDKTLYLGYGPDYITLSALASVGTAPYTYKWSPGGRMASSIEVSPSATTTYTVAVADINGQTASDQVTVIVVEARCGNKNDKVLVCHEERPPCIVAGDAAAHLKHGDRSGNCMTAPLMTGIEQRAETRKQTDSLPERFRVRIVPNPSKSSMRFLYELPENGKISIRIYDEAGRVVATVIQAEQKKGKYQQEFSVKKIAAGQYFYQAFFTVEQKAYTQTGMLVITH